MSAKGDIKKFGEKAVEDMVKEYIQIDKDPMEGKPLVISIDPDKFYYEENMKALGV